MIRLVRRYHDALVREAKRTHITKASGAIQRRMCPLFIVTLVLSATLIFAPDLPKPLQGVMFALIFVLTVITLGTRLHAHFVFESHARREFPNPDDYY